MHPRPPARLAVLLKGGLAADVSEILPDGKVLRPYYSGNLIAEVEFKSPVCVMTLAPMSYPRAEASGTKGEVVAASFDPGASESEAVSYQPEQSNEIDLGGAEIDGDSEEFVEEEEEEDLGD